MKNTRFFFPIAAICLWAATTLCPLEGGAQIDQKLSAAWEQMIRQEQLSYASAGICVLDAPSGKVLFSRSGKTGLAPASTTKIVTSIAAMDALGPAFAYRTRVWLTGRQDGDTWLGNLILEGSGDPSLGSWRYASTKDDAQLKSIAKALQARGIRRIQGEMLVYNTGYDINPTPGYWPYADIGNYYGAGVFPLNYYENQYDAIFSTGKKIGDSTHLVRTKPESVPITSWHNQVLTAAAGSGDNSVIFNNPYSSTALIQGTLPLGEKAFTVSGSVPDGETYLLQNLRRVLKDAGISTEVTTYNSLTINSLNKSIGILPSDNPLISVTSPTLDTLVYWFMKKSINLYGEALTRTIGLRQKQAGSTEAGISWLEENLRRQQIDPAGLHLTDGSGLSPTNRLAPESLCKLLWYAQSRPWFPAFYHSFPEYNGMKLKSGTIYRVKCYAGYHTAANGKKYIVAIMVNNYAGSSSAVVGQMFKVLDVLK